MAASSCRSPDLKVEQEGVVEAEGVDHSHVGAHLHALRMFPHACPPHAEVGRAVVDALGVEAADDVGHVEHAVQVEVVERELLLHQPVAVAALAGHVHAGAVGGKLAVAFLLRGAAHGQAAIGEPHAEAGREPFSHGHVQGGSHAVEELHLLVVVAEEDLSAEAGTDKPVVPEVVGLHFILVVVVHLHHRGVCHDHRGVLLCGCSQEGDGAQRQHKYSFDHIKISFFLARIFLVSSV